VRNPGIRRRAPEFPDEAERTFEDLSPAGIHEIEGRRMEGCEDPVSWAIKKLAAKVFHPGRRGIQDNPADGQPRQAKPLGLRMPSFLLR